jgi:preprotein translocase subunit YajC
VSQWLPYVLIIVVFGGLAVLTSRNRRRQLLTQQERTHNIAVGTDVMTTSGLYGTVVARNDDDTLLLAVAPGVELRWAAAALRDVRDLPAPYRPPQREPDDPR